MDWCKRISKKISSSISMFFVSAFVLFSMPVLAQGVDDEAVLENNDEEKAEKTDVTGSLIRRSDINTAAPVVTIEKMELDTSGVVSIGDVLQNIPAQSNAINSQANKGGDGSTRINLRALGATRTLVLVNGHRMPHGGNGANASTDLNSIPTAIIERVEILKDGASSIYGSDAVGGVVNIITKKDFEGVEASAYTGTSGHFDGTVYDLSVTIGHKFDRGNLVVSGGIYENKHIMAGDRDFSKYDFWDDTWDPALIGDCDPKYVDGNVCFYRGGSTGIPEGLIVAGDEPANPGNQAWQNLLAEYQDNSAWVRDRDTGLWRPFNGGGTSDTGEGDSYNYQPENYLYTPQQRYSLYAEGGYDFNDYVHGFFETSFVNRKSDQLYAAEPLFTISEGITVSKDNIYNPFERDFDDVRRRMIEAGGRNFIQDVYAFRAVVGFEGDLPQILGPFSGWHWDLAYLYGNTTATETNQGNFFKQRFENALGPSFKDASGVPRCGVQGGGPGGSDLIINSCVPLNLFGGPGSITQDMLNYVGYTGISKGFNEIESVRFQITGDLFKIPIGGTVAMALGYEYREESGASQPHPLSVLGESSGNKSDAVGGEFFVNEVYGELSIPVIENMPGVELLEISTSGRFFNYNTFGNDFTFKVGARWQIIPDLSIRTTYSTAFRAPPIFNLYAGQFDSFPHTLDPCSTVSPAYQSSETVRANCQADGVVNDDLRSMLKARIGGNPKLGPETANVFTAGIVVQPSIIEGLTATIGFWNYHLEKTIGTFGSSTIMNLCYDQPKGQRKYCDLIHRYDDSHMVDYVVNTYNNVGQYKTWGIDFQVRYDLQADFGKFLFNVDGTYTGKYEYINPMGDVLKGLGVYDLTLALPNWRFNTGVIWSHQEFGAGLTARYFGSFRECEGNNCEDHDTQKAFGRDVDPNLTFDLFVSYALESDIGTTKLILGVNNLLDADPEVIYNGFTATSEPSAYDFIGRFFYARFNQTF